MDRKTANRTPPALHYRPPPGDPVIVHRDDRLLVVEKPAGLLSVPGKAAMHRDCLQSRLVSMLPGTLLVHRLDMDTSGLMVFAMMRAAQRHLGLQFERRHVAKTYEARVHGQLAQEEGEVDLPLIADWPNRPLQKVCFETGKPAFTRWRRIGGAEGWSRVLLFPQTGRSHQLRVHMAAIGHPILGDRFYGDAATAGSATRLQLHASALAFFHPADGRRVRFESPSPF